MFDEGVVGTASYASGTIKTRIALRFDDPHGSFSQLNRAKN